MRFFAFAVSILITVSAWGQGVPNKINLVSDLSYVQEPQAISFYQGESIELTLQVNRDGFPASYSTNGLPGTDFFAIWEVMSTTNPLAAYIAENADLTDSTNGVFVFRVEPSESMMVAGRYDGFIRLFEKDPISSTYFESAVFSRQNIDVRFAPNSQEYNFVGPIWYDSFDPENLTVERVTATQVESYQFRLINDPLGYIDAWGDLAADPTIDNAFSIQDSSESYGDPDYSIIANGTAQPRKLYKIAGEDGISIFYTQGVLVITGNATNSVDQLFPFNPANNGRLYYRPSSGSGSDPFTFVGGMVNTSGVKYLTWNGTNIVVADAVLTQATNAVLFAGSGPDYYRDVANHTNFWIVNDPVSNTVISTTFRGMVAGDNLFWSSYNLTNGTMTQTVWRLDAWGPTNTGLVGTSNFWTNINIFNAGLQSRNRITLSGNNNNMSGSWATLGVGASNNQAVGNFSTVGGGTGNQTPSTYATVGGGTGNKAQAQGATVGGGSGNIAGGSYSVVAGGDDNIASGLNPSGVLGGKGNRAQGSYSAVLGGDYVQALADRTFGFGRYITMNHDNSFVFGYGQAATNPVTTATNNTILFTGTGGSTFKLGINTNLPLREIDVIGDGIVRGNFEATSMTLNGSTITEWNVASGTITGAVATNSWLTASVNGANIEIGATGTPLFAFTTLFAGPTSTGLVASTSSDTNLFLRGDGTWQVAAGVSGATNYVFTSVSSGAAGEVIWQSNSADNAQSYFTVNTNQSPGVTNLWDLNLVDVEVTPAQDEVFAFDGAAWTNYPVEVWSNSFALQTWTLQTVNSDTFSASSYDSVLCTGSSTVNLPNATGQGIVRVKKLDSGSIVVIKAIAGQEIDGANTINLTKQYESVELQGNGVTNWWIY